MESIAAGKLGMVEEVDLSRKTHLILSALALFSNIFTTLRKAWRSIEMVKADGINPD